MHNTTSLFSGSSRAGLFVALAASVLALTPSTASADALICNGAGACLHVGASCDYWNPMPPGYICFSLGPVAMIGPIIRENNGGASVVISGKTNVLISQSRASAEKLESSAARRKSAGDKQAAQAFQKELDATVRSSDRKVSDEDLKKISKAFNLTVETKAKK